MLVTDSYNFVNVEVARHRERHIVQVVKSVITAVKQLGRDLRYRLYRARDVVPHGVCGVQRAEQIEKAFSVRQVHSHFYLLPDYALLFVNIFLSEVGVLHEVEQYFQRLGVIFSAGEKVYRVLKARHSVAVSAGSGVKLENIAVLVFKKLVLQIVGDAVGYCKKIGVLRSLEAVIYRAVICAEHSRSLHKTLHRRKKQVKPRLMMDYLVAFARALVHCRFYSSFTHMLRLLRG